MPGGDPCDCARPARESVKKAFATRLVRLGQAGRAEDGEPLPVSELIKLHKSSRQPGARRAAGADCPGGFSRLFVQLGMLGGPSDGGAAGPDGEAVTVP